MIVPSFGWFGKAFFVFLRVLRVFIHFLKGVWEKWSMREWYSHPKSWTLNPKLLNP